MPQSCHPLATQKIPVPWHAKPADEVLRHLHSSTSGLSQHAAQRQLADHGENALQSAPRPSALKRLLHQLQNTLVLILIGAAVLAGLIGDLHDAAVISVVIAFNALLGFIQEERANTALQALKNLSAPTARVRRDGHVRHLKARELVPGDIIELEAGDPVPADARILVAHGAEVDEAVLTGESQPIGKTASALHHPDTVLAERSNMLFSSTVVTRGRLEAIVCATGMATAVGQLAGLLVETPVSKTPLQRQLDTLGQRLALIALGVVTLVFILGLAQGRAWLDTAMIAIALAVAAIPEGLPAVVTVTLALGMHRMAKRHALIKRLDAAETLGCTSVICTDKTGTLTLNQMTVRQIYAAGVRYTVTGEGYAAHGTLRPAHGSAAQPQVLQTIAAAAALCADARLRDATLIGDPTEGALLALAAKAGVAIEAYRDAHPRIGEIPFDAAHKFMATFHYDAEWVQIWVKGAPDVLLQRAEHQLSQDGLQPLDAPRRAEFAKQNAALAGQALRVIALAGRRIPAHGFNPAAPLLPWLEKLTLLGLCGLHDPPRPEVKAAIAHCHSAGIRVMMLTGDQRLTAAAIAKELGIPGAVHDGAALNSPSGDALSDLIQTTGVFARVTPEHKLHIVRALQSRGEVVAMTGDGVNDAPALKAADIGIAMGRSGTAVSREAAVMVLTDDNFASIVQAVKEGRALYDNLLKFIRFQLSTNIGALLTVLAAPLLGLPIPFTPLQILWVNIIMDGPPAMLLGNDPSRPGLLREPPRAAGAPLLGTARIMRIGLYGLLMAAGTLGLYAWALPRHGPLYASTLAFTTFVLFQFFNIFNARAESHSAFNRQFFSNVPLWLTLVGMLILHASVVHTTAAQMLFDTVDLTSGDWLLAALVAGSILCLDELGKAIFRRGTKRPPANIQDRGLGRP